MAVASVLRTGGGPELLSLLEEDHGFSTFFNRFLASPVRNQSRLRNANRYADISTSFTVTSPLWALSDLLQVLSPLPWICRRDLSPTPCC